MGLGGGTGDGEERSKWTPPKYDVGQFQRACQRIRDSKRRADDLPPAVREHVYEILLETKRGVYEAALALYAKSELPAPKTPTAGSDSDYETDKGVLKELVSRRR